MGVKRGVYDRDNYLSSLIIMGTLCSTFQEKKADLLIVDHGQPIHSTPTISEVLCDFLLDNVFIKGANMVDTSGMEETFFAHPELVLLIKGDICGCPR